MVKTYTLYLRDGGAHQRFVPAMCLNDVEALSRARALLEVHPECETIDIYYGDSHLFSVGRARTSHQSACGHSGNAAHAAPPASESPPQPGPRLRLGWRP